MASLRFFFVIICNGFWAVIKGRSVYWLTASLEHRAIEYYAEDSWSSRDKNYVFRLIDFLILKVVPLLSPPHGVFLRSIIANFWRLLFIVFTSSWQA